MIRHLLLAAVFVFVSAAGGAIALKPEPGRWYAIPNSRLDQQAGVFPPVPTPQGRPGNVLVAWSGAAYDSKRARVLFHGGGHVDYAGNEVYAFDVNTFRWSRIWGPSPQIPAAEVSEGRDEYPDGNPAAVHSYDGLNYIPDVDKLWRGGGSLWSGSGGGTQATWMLDLASNRWQRMANSRVLGVSVTSEYDPVSGHVFALSDHNVLGEYDPKRNRWSYLGVAPGQGGARHHGVSADHLHRPAGQDPGDEQVPLHPLEELLRARADGRDRGLHLPDRPA